MKILKSEEGYRDNLTSFEGFSAEIRIFYETSMCFCLLSALRYWTGSQSLYNREGNVMNWYLRNASGAGEKALHHLDSALAVSAHPKSACPREILRAQRLLEIEYFSFDGDVHTGQLVVHRQVERSVKEIFRQLLSWKFPVGSMVPVAAFEWDDELSMMANNTSGFNYRRIAGKEKLSWHAHGLAIDVNPRLNPWMEKGVTKPRGARYDPDVRGTIVPDGEVVRLFEFYGFEWGGYWTSLKDYHHFQFPRLS